MRNLEYIFAVDSHTMGEPTRLVLGGIGTVSGSTMAEKRRYMAKNLDHFRTALMHEPRGHGNMFGAYIVEPSNPEADLGVIFMDCSGYLNMCGHGTVGVVTVALEMGLVDLKEPMTQVILDTPAGIVRATAHTAQGRVMSVLLRNVPSFLYQESLPIDLPGIGTVLVDIAYGGNFCALVEADRLNLELVPENIAGLTQIGADILQEINRKTEAVHPVEAHIQGVDLVEICAPVQTERACGKNIVIFGRGQFDRSPCGTGTCARMAALYAKGDLGLEEDFISESIIGTSFSGRVLEETMVGGIKAVIPQITAQAFITGIHQFIIDPADPLKYGFLA